jgi:HAD superfamily hydrolase (TIGR01450 family)
MEESHQELDLVRGLRHVVLDLDGTIYLGDQLFPWTKPFLTLLEHLGIDYSFITNNSSRSATEYLYRLRAMGLDVDLERIFTSAHATIEYLRQTHPQIGPIFVLGTPSLREEMREAGFLVAADDARDNVDAVVVGFDTTLTYERLCRAAYWIEQGKLYLATHPDRICPTDQATVLPDCGAICACLESATGRVPEAVLGKPQASMIDSLRARYGIAAAEVAVVGDRLYTDMELARQSGALGVLVLSGETDHATAVATQPGPDLILTDLSEFGELLQSACRKK